MPKFFVNGNECTVDEPEKLIYYLRDTLKLTSVKDGCTEGACGTCMVLVDGKPQKACVLRTDRLEGKHILTVEGLSEREREVYAYAFMHAGAVQCGFCTPGMILSVKSLLDENPSPDDEAIKKALEGNLCRCTGYVKIIEAVKRAVAIIKSQGLMI